MKVCVCGGTNPATNVKFTSSARRIGELFCDHDIELIWGGNQYGVLAAIHQVYIERKKPNTLYLPKTYIDDLNGMTTDKVVILETIGERQDAMSHNSDAIVFVPGGIGTLYEFWASVEALRSGEINAKLFLYNFEGFYDKQIEFFEFINQNGFTKTGLGGSPYKIKPEDLFTVVETPEDLIQELLKMKK